MKQNKQALFQHNPYIYFLYCSFCGDLIWLNVDDYKVNHQNKILCMICYNAGTFNRGGI